MAEPQGTDMGGSVDIATVRDMRDQILREMAAGFKGVHARQDKTNGRIDGLQERAARHEERFVAIEREHGEQCERVEVLEREREAFFQHRRASDPLPPVAIVSTSKEETGDNRRITQRDVRVLVLGAGGALALFKLLPWLITLGQAGKP